MMSSFTIPSSYCYYFLCFSVFTNICISSVFFPPPPPPTSRIYSTVSYSDHCASIVPESSPTARSYNHPIPLLVTNYYTGGDRILGRRPSETPYYYVTKSLKLQITPNYYGTNVEGIYKVEAYLYIRSPYHYYDNARRNYSYGGSYYHRSRAHRSGSITFWLNGFWSESSRKLCMVGSASWLSEEGQALNVDAVLKLKFANKNPTILASFVSGVLESTNSADQFGYFDPLLIFSFPVLPDYSYSLVLKELDGGFSGDVDVPRNKSLNLQPSRFCSMVSGRYFVFELEYATECKTSQNCSPLGQGYGYLPSFMSLDLIQCSGDEQNVRYMIRFRNITRGVFYQDFDVDWTLIGEGSWDDKKNRLLIAACRILNPDDHPGNAVEDCTIRLSLRYPSTWTIRDDAKIVGQIWTNRTVNDSGYFRKIKLKSSDENDMLVFPGLRYEYTELDRVGKSCPVNKLVEKERNRYPDRHSYDMKFDISVKNSKGQKFAWGDAMPLSVGNEFYQKYPMNVSEESMAPESYAGIGSLSEAEKKTLAPLNISYKIGIRPFRKVKFDNWFPTLNWSMNLRSRVEITAEGVYDAETGQLCMVGCRKLLSYNQNSTNHSTDCEIRVNFKFVPLDARRGGLIKGIIRSTRAKLDPLYFEDLSLSSAAFYRTVAKQSIWRMDLEIAMVLVSSTLVCIFVGLQLFHVKRNPEVLPCISLVMLLILSLGHMIPLVLNFEALLLGNRKKPATVNSGGWLEANEVTVRVVTMVAFLLQVRLLQLVWTAKQTEVSEKGFWSGDKKAALVSLSMYLSGELLALLVNWTRKRHGHQDYQKHSLWGDLRSYTSLILDGFLLPQILSNTFRGSSEKALAHSFYIGISMVRLVPHAYDQYRTHNYPTYNVNGTYYYANPTAEFYSTAWDVIIPCGVVTFAVIVYLQQRYGGRCILPTRFRELGLHEKVPVVNND
ncbi:hypothetical protein Pfo_014125 [Paulownia fortunei]|nr:hypothetical protein Pfo_014125 [Paulownia fortunei]